MRKLRTLAVILAAFVVAIAPAQAGGGNDNQIPDRLGSYLNLDWNQARNINEVLSDLYAFGEQKFQRYSEVQREVDEIRNNPGRDPLTIGNLVGIRTTEQVTIEREVDERTVAAQKKIVAVLNPLQKALLGKLAEVLQLQDVAWAAVSASFLMPPPMSGQSTVPTPPPSLVPMPAGSAANFLRLFGSAHSQSAPK